MNNSEKKVLVKIKEELVILRLQTRVLTEDGFKKQIGKIIKMVESINGDSVENNV